MQQSLNKSISSPYWPWILLAIITALGIVFRIINLDSKPVWGDETHTFSVISGYSGAELAEKFTNAPITIETFLKYQYPNPETTLGGVLYKLYTDVHPPLYFLTALGWVELFGHSIATLRGLSAAFGILSLPCMYWLGLELFASPLVAGIGMALLSVSPFQVIYAQEARPYSILTLVILFSSASLLWALRTRKRVAWCTFAISIALGLYTQLFFLFAIAGYGAYVLVIESFRFTKNFRNFLLANLAGFIAFLPWAIVVLNHLSDFKEKSAWVGKRPLSISGAIRWWSHNISLSFIDPWTSEHFGFGEYALYPLIPFILALVAYSIYFLCLKQPKRVYLFIFALIISTALPLIMADVILGGNRQIWARYLIPCFLGFQLSTAHLLATQIFSIEPIQKKSWRTFWQIVAVTLITSGIIFCTIFAQANLWWNKYDGKHTINNASSVNQAENPLVIINNQYPGHVIFFSLKPETKLLFIPQEKSDLASIIEDTKNVFLLNPSNKLKLELQSKKYILKQPVPGYGSSSRRPVSLWKVIKPNAV